MNFDADVDAFGRLIAMLQHAQAIMQALPDRSGVTTAHETQEESL